MIFINLIFLLTTLLLTKQLKHLIAVFELNWTEIGIYFPFDYLSLNNREVNYLVIMAQRKAQSQSVTKWKLDRKKQVMIMENLLPGKQVTVNFWMISIWFALEDGYFSWWYWQGGLKFYEDSWNPSSLKKKWVHRSCKARLKIFSKTFH